MGLLLFQNQTTLNDVVFSPSTYSDKVLYFVIHKNFIVHNMQSCRTLIMNLGVLIQTSARKTD
jgi:hypothetical protein